MAFAILLFQQQRCEIDLVSGNELNAKLLKDFHAIKEAEQLVGRLVVQLFSIVRIDSTHHKCDIILSQSIK